MSVPILPSADEAEILRLAETYACGLPSRVGDPALSALVRQAAESNGVPMACVTMLGRDAECIIAAHGFAPESLPRNDSVCSDMVGCLLDPQRAAHPWASGSPQAGFIAWHGLWLKSGERVGTLYLLDVRPDDWNDSRSERMRVCASDLVAEFVRQSARPDLADEAIEPIVHLVREAAQADHEALVVSLDRVLRRVEKIARSQRG